MISKEEKMFQHFKLPSKKKTIKMRKLVVSDIFGITDIPVKHDYRHKQGNRVKRYRQQQEYGEKMQIKP